MGETVAVRHRFRYETKGLDRRVSGSIVDVYARGMRQPSDRKAVPIGQDFVVARGLSPLIAPCKENIAKSQQVVFIALAQPFPRLGVEAVQDVRTLEIAAWRDAMDAGEGLEVGTEHLLQLVPRPDVGQPLLV